MQLRDRVLRVTYCRVKDRPTVPNNVQVGAMEVRRDARKQGRRQGRGPRPTSSLAGKHACGKGVATHKVGAEKAIGDVPDGVRKGIQVQNLRVSASTRHTHTEHGGKANTHTEHGGKANTHTAMEV